ncbi:HNH endonuclease signature motif containing protein [Isoptericola sp. NPDC056134]|uniref:HNH endonuclease signature motif containing protein n=1 Tax=Isoptericola sp. NPDC056134 TaxID=3345723 RepID=UPI0035ED8239
MSAVREVASCDEAIVEALRLGVIEVDTAAGDILRDGRVLRGRVSDTGYRQVSLLGWLCYEHRIVWTAAHGPAGDATVNHRNADKLDNRLTNLEAVSRGDNVKLWFRQDHYDHQVHDQYATAGQPYDEAPEIQEARAMAARGASRREVAEFIQAWRDRRADDVA